MTELQHLAEKRAAALAYLALTGRDDLDVQVAPPAGGPFDVVVRLTGRRKGVRQFAVMVASAVEADTPADADRQLASKVKALAKVGPYPIPAVVLLFTLRGNGGYIAWVSEPGSDGQLVLRTKPAFRLLEAEMLDEVVQSVDEWYDARNAAVSMRG